MLSKILKGNDDVGPPEDMSMYLNCLSIESLMSISSACRFLGAGWILLLPLWKTGRQRRRFLRGVDIPSWKQSCVGKTSRISLACLSWATHYTGERGGDQGLTFAWKHRIIITFFCQEDNFGYNTGKQDTSWKTIINWEMVVLLNLFTCFS